MALTVLGVWQHRVTLSTLTSSTLTSSTRTPATRTLSTPLSDAAMLISDTQTNTVAALAGGIVAVVLLGRVVADLATSVQVRGQILRCTTQNYRKRTDKNTTRYWLAFDDGQSHTALAYLCDRLTWAHVAEGDVVDLVYYRRCRWIKRATIVTASRFRGQ
jgi:hypothetical protein